MARPEKGRTGTPAKQKTVGNLADKLGKSITLNEEFVPSRGLMPIIRPMTKYGPMALGLLVAYKLASRLVRGKKQ